MAAFAGSLRHYTTACNRFGCWSHRRISKRAFGQLDGCEGYNIRALKKLIQPERYCPSDYWRRQ
jgi:hypothetical protein